MLAALARYTPEEYKEAIKEKKPKKIRIMLFYDGTLNNRMNIEEREADTKIYKKKRDEDGPNSYDNGRTNIAIMEPHVSDKKGEYKGYDLVYKHYIAGQGAITRKKDSVWGYALAIGESGVPHRAEEGINYAVNSIYNDDKNINPQEHYIKKLTIDVFGFSRGAATARYSIHVIFNGRIANVSEAGDVQYEWDPVANRLNDFDYVIKEESVEVGFAGLYDTVLSYVGSQKVEWSNNVLQQKAVARAKKSLHLAAADEHRSDFPLHNIKGAVSKGGEEYYLPGVHSDVGGSYNLANELVLQKKDIPESKKVYMRPSSEGLKEGMSIKDSLAYKGLVINESHDRNRLEKDRDDLIAQGWYTNEETTIMTTKWDEYGRPREYALSVKRPGIRSAYCNIPLKIMAKYARNKGLLKIDTKLEDRANIILRPEKDLQELEGVINNYIASNKNSKAKDWIDDNAALNTAKLKAIRHRHFHFSSKPGMGYSPRFIFDHITNKHRRRRFVYDP